MDKITEKTLLPLGLIVTLATSVIGSTWWMSALYSRVARAEDSINDLVSSRKEMVNELRAMNFTLIEIRTELKKK